MRSAAASLRDNLVAASEVVPRGFKFNHVVPGECGLLAPAVLAVCVGNPNDCEPPQRLTCRRGNGSRHLTAHERDRPMHIRARAGTTRRGTGLFVLLFRSYLEQSPRGCVGNGQRVKTFILGRIPATPPLGEPCDIASRSD